MTGPIARMNLNYDRLPPPTHNLLAGTGIRFPSQNRYHNLVARAAEIHVAVLEAIRLLQDYAEPEQSYREPQVRAGTGVGNTRGGPAAFSVDALVDCMLEPLADALDEYIRRFPEK